jgi:uncharacterized protein Yka (UPF0111/DUF47 family)
MTIRDRFAQVRRFSILPPKDRIFYAYCEQMAAYILEASGGLLDLFATSPDNPDRKGEIDAEITALEADGDKMVKLVIHYLGRVQQPPFNRDDINDLIHHLDDILDRIKVAATFFIDRGLGEGDATMRAMARNLHEECRNLVEAIATLRKRSSLEPYVDAVRKFERQSDEEFHSGFRRCTEKVQIGNATVDMKLRELKASLTTATDGTVPTAALLGQFYAVLEAVHEHSRHTALFTVLRDEYEALEQANNNCRRAMVTLNRMVVSNG